VRNPIPLGFGESALGVGNVQLPFAIVLLIFGPTSGFIISRLGSIKPIIAGSVITSAGFFALWLVHSNPFCVSAGLAVLSVGLSLTSVGAMNIVILATPPKYSGISLGMTSLLRIVGSSVGPVVAAVYLQTLQSRISIGSGIFGSFPSQESFGLVFLTAAVASLVSVGLALTLRSILSKIHIPNLS
jgi:MFS family permease